MEPLVNLKKRLGRPRKDETRDTRQLILDVALDLFSQHGYRNTSVRAIAHAVGVTEAALYQYFSSKKAILEELWQTYGPQGFPRIVATVPSSEEAFRNPRELVRHYTHLLFSSWLAPEARKFSRIVMTDMLLNEDLDTVETMRAAVKDVDCLLQEGARALIGRGKLKPLPVTQMVDVFKAPLLLMRMEFCQLERSAIDEPALRSAIDTHVDFVFDLFET